MRDEQSNKRSWILVGTWFGTIVLLGVLKRVLEPGRLQAAALLEPRLLPPSTNQGRPRGRP